jgi:hypothetical protein
MMQSWPLLLLTACQPVIPLSGDGTDTGGGADSAACDEAACDSGQDTDDTDTGVEEIPGRVWEHPGVLILEVGQSIPEDDKVPGTLSVIRDHDGTLGDLSDVPIQWQGNIGIEHHGSSSSDFDKPSFRIELRDEDGEDLDYALLDLPSESDWVLYGPYSDKTLIRNAFSYGIGRLLSDGSGQWQPRHAFCEIYIDGRYGGAYLLLERIKRGDHRVDIPRPAASAAEGDVTGGYILKVDQHRNEGWTTARGTPFDYHWPKHENLSTEQIAYIHGWFDDLETVLASPGWDDPATGYAAWMDVDSFVDHLLLNEFSHNVDALRLSAYMVKEAEEDGGLLRAGPFWDFNLGFGNADYCNGWDTETAILDDRCGGAAQYPPWWDAFMADPEFTTRLRCRWESLRVDELSDAALETRLDDLIEEAAPLEARDHQRWPTLGVELWPNWYVGETWDDELGFMRTWTLERAAWMDAALPGLCAR